MYYHNIIESLESFHSENEMEENEDDQEQI